MSSDTVSSLFPDRPIRPLPTRRLRERLSPEVADSIKYPPSTLNAVPLFQYPPYTVKDDGSPPGTGPTSPIEQNRRSEPPRNYTPRRNGLGGEAGDTTDAASRSTWVTRSSPEILTRATGRPARSDQPRQVSTQPPPSTASSVDGYDSFENTNNKKKRKIPSAGDSTLSGAHTLSADVHSHSVHGGATAIGELNGERAYHPGAGYPGSGSLGAGSSGVSGSGRGRLGRSRNGRSPLRALPDGNNAWVGRPSKNSQPHWASSEFEGVGSGIISNAIANAGKHPPQGQENVSLLQQSSTARTTPTSTQFTFTCDSQVPGTLKWPGHSGRANMSGYQTPHGEMDPHVKARNSRERQRRRTDRELAAAARDRRQMQTARNAHNPPKQEDIWICEFCEYESIFGKPPKALIRQYELKDRRVRQEEADRKRLLEKAKAKGRKAKKNGKGASRGNTSVNQPSEEPVDGYGDSLDHNGHGHSTQSEEEELDDGDFAPEYGEEPLSPSPRPPAQPSRAEAEAALIAGEDANPGVPAPGPPAQIT